MLSGVGTKGLDVGHSRRPCSPSGPWQEPRGDTSLQRGSQERGYRSQVRSVGEQWTRGSVGGHPRQRGRRTPGRGSPPPPPHVGQRSSPPSEAAGGTGSAGQASRARGHLRGQQTRQWRSEAWFEGFLSLLMLTWRRGPGSSLGTSQPPSSPGSPGTLGTLTWAGLEPSQPAWRSAQWGVAPPRPGRCGENEARCVCVCG